MTNDERIKKIERTTLIGSAGNMVLTVFKFVAGWLGHSSAMIADAVHSLSDFISDIIVIVFVRISGKPGDRTHTYGHGKYETFATGIIGIMLLLAGVFIAWEGCAKIIDFINGIPLGKPGMIALWAALISIAVKEGLYQYTVRVGRKIDSPAVIANAWHHRSDSLSSIATTVGIGGAILLGEKWYVLDPIAAVLVSLFIIKVSITLSLPAFHELMESALPEEIEQKIMETVASQPGISQPHNLRTRRVGQVNVVDIHVRMPDEMTVRESHEITKRIEDDLRKFLGNNSIINIHVEPASQAELHELKRRNKTNESQSGK